jgi:hypothetical protein
MAVEEAMEKSHSDNKAVQDYFKNNEPNITSKKYVFIILLILIDNPSCYCMFKICFSPSHNIKPFFPTYKPRSGPKGLINTNRKEQVRNRHL